MPGAGPQDESGPVNLTNPQLLAKGMLNTSAPIRPLCPGNKRTAGRVCMLAVAALALAAFLVSAGCVSFMRNLNPWASRGSEKPSPPADSKSSSAKESPLKRPKIPELAQPGEHEPEGSRTSIKVAPERASSEVAAKDKAKGERKSGESSGSGDKPEREKKAGTSAAASSESATSDAEHDIDSKEAFKKHDHVGYVEVIKTKADELVKKQSNCTLARLCRHTITDEWTLQVYVRRAKTFSFVLYSWDEIDEKWEKSYESEDRPATQWEHHLRFSSASKECTDIKGKER